VPAYDQAGTYPVTFTVTDSLNAIVSETIQITVSNVDRPPVSRITVLGVSGHTVRLSRASSSDPDTGDTLTYIWYCEVPFAGIFGVPSYSPYGVETTVTYPSNMPSGTYRIWLYVTDSSGMTSAAPVSVHINWPPVARILISTKIILRIYYFMGYPIIS
jgi:hypothetical protein